MRGVNHEHTWFTNQTSSFANIKAPGANTVRVVLSGGRWTANSATDVANVVSLCKQNRLICVLEDHDTTGYGEDGAAVHARPGGQLLDQPEERPGRPGELRRHQHRQRADRQHQPRPVDRATTAAIQKMRSNGFQHLLMVDAPELGPGLAVRHARQRADRARRRHPAQHRAVDPHVRRVQHRRGDHRLPEHVPDQGLAAGHRRVRLAGSTPARSTTRPCMSEAVRPAASATSAGRGPATTIRSST